MATLWTMQAAKTTAAFSARPMPFFPRSTFAMPAACMGMSSAASIFILGTGVSTSVSLFILLLLVTSLLVGLLVVLISLLLTGLTGLVGLESLVGLTKNLATRTTQGD